MWKDCYHWMGYLSSKMHGLLHLVVMSILALLIKLCLETNEISSLQSETIDRVHGNCADDWAINQHLNLDPSESKILHKEEKIAAISPSMKLLTSASTFIVDSTASTIEYMSKVHMYSVFVISGSSQLLFSRSIHMRIKKINVYTFYFFLGIHRGRCQT